MSQKFEVRVKFWSEDKVGSFIEISGLVLLVERFVKGTMFEDFFFKSAILHVKVFLVSF